MIPHKLTLRNFMCYRDDVPPLQFDGLNVVCLSGENGAGKSTLLDAITWALWGRARAKSDDDLIAMGQSDMEVDFEFVLDGILRRVIRRRTKGKRGQTVVDFQVCDADGIWRRISGDSVRDTDAQIAAALRMNYETFINSAFLLQGRADEFTNRKPAERKQVLADILGLTEYERLEARAKERRSACDAELHNLAGLIDEYQRQVARRPFLVDEVGRTGERASALAHEVARSEEAVQSLRAESDRLRQIAKERGALETLIGRHGAELREVERETAAIEQVLATAEAMIGRRVEIEAGVARLQRLEARLEEYEYLRDEYQRLAEEQRVIDAALGAIRLGLERDRNLAAERVASLAAQAGETRMLQAELARLDVEAGEYAALHDERDRLRAGQMELEDRQQQLADLQARKMRLEEPLKEIRSSLLAEQSQLVRSIQTLEQAVIRLPQIERELRDVRHQLLQMQSAEKQLTALRDELQ
ncbi:MAG TPA: SMC family ATPase, partial [Herpetosiphonaceae bacterium]|nr:SMC family ATPase [Herpetosiphonaceae bacterium]